MRRFGWKLFIAFTCLFCSVFFAACGKAQSRIDGQDVHVLNLDGGDEKQAPKSAAGGNGNHVVTLTPATGYEAPLIVEEKADNKGGKDRLAHLQSEKVRAGVGGTKVTQCMAEQKGNYMYEMMEEELRPLYAELYLILRSHEENILVSAKDSDELQKAFLCLFQDHPDQRQSS